MGRKRGCDVDCREAQGLIVPFIKSELTMEQAKTFFQHIDNCPDCKEELEVYYMMMVGMKELDEDNPKSLDLHSQFEELLDRSRTEINKHHLRKTPRMVLFFGTYRCSVGFNHKGTGTYCRAGEYPEQGGKLYLM